MKKIFGFIGALALTAGLCTTNVHAEEGHGHGHGDEGSSQTEAAELDYLTGIWEIRTDEIFALSTLETPSHEHGAEITPSHGRGGNDGHQRILGRFNFCHNTEATDNVLYGNSNYRGVIRNAATRRRLRVDTDTAVTESHDDHSFNITLEPNRRNTTETVRLKIYEGTQDQFYFQVGDESHYDHEDHDHGSNDQGSHDHSSIEASAEGHDHGAETSDDEIWVYLAERRTDNASRSCRRTLRRAVRRAQRNSQ